MNHKMSLLTTAAAFAVLASAGGASAQSSDLVAAAKKEGQLSVIALPRDWCGYGAIIDGFKAKYGLQVNELNPDAGSGDEVEAIKANKGNAGPAGTGCDRCRPRLRPLGQEGQLDPALQGRDLVDDPRFSARTPTAPGMAITTACSPSR